VRNAISAEVEKLRADFNGRFASLQAFNVLNSQINGEAGLATRVLALERGLAQTNVAVAGKADSSIMNWIMNWIYGLAGAVGLLFFGYIFLLGMRVRQSAPVYGTPTVVSLSDRSSGPASQQSPPMANAA
jgi:hypothetical protein